MGKMKIVLYPSANPDRHGPIGVEIEVDAEQGSRWVCEGIARVVEHDKPPDTRPVARLVEEPEPEPELEDDDDDDDDEDDNNEEAPAEDPIEDPTEPGSDLRQ